jgi:enterochelin esterase-like enzyme/sugar lactone lactonase YvrE
MRFQLLLLLILLLPPPLRAEPDFPLTDDSKPNPATPKGELVKGSHTAKAGSVFPGTEREYTLYLPSGLDKTKPAPFMVFQDGVIYQAPTVFDNLIAKKDIPPLVGVFVKPGVVPAANENALPRFNRSYEYDSVTDTYSRFLIEEFLPAMEKTHGIKFSTDPNDSAISGNSSGGIAAFMVAWHRHDRFRRVFTGVGTYVGIRGADQLPVLIRKFEPKPLKVFLQSGTGDNNLYCGDWWMANQMMERSLTWAGYDVNHAWGEGGHNQKHASQIFPDVLRWLWTGWPDEKEVKANAKSESKWKGYEVCVEREAWKNIALPEGKYVSIQDMTANKEGEVFIVGQFVDPEIGQRSAPRRIGEFLVGQVADGYDDGYRNVTWKIDAEGKSSVFARLEGSPLGLAFDGNGILRVSANMKGYSGPSVVVGYAAGGNQVGKPLSFATDPGNSLVWPSKIDFSHSGILFFTTAGGMLHTVPPDGKLRSYGVDTLEFGNQPSGIALSPDQTLLYFTGGQFNEHIGCFQIAPDGTLKNVQRFCHLDGSGNGQSSIIHASSPCVDTDGRLYVATSLGVQVCDQAGRVNFIIPTPPHLHNMCFGGKDLSELFIACGDKIYKRQTKVHGIVSGQTAPIKPAAPKL